MTGFALIGAFFAPRHLSCADAARLLAFFLGIFCLFTSIYSFNSCMGHANDRNNPRLKNLHDGSVQWFQTSTLVFLISGIGLLTLLHVILAIMGTACFLLWCLYSWPNNGVKGLPLAGTGLHFISQVLHFHMGYCLFASPSVNSLAVSLYFACLFSAGHLHHETIDHKADGRSRIQTTAVAYGLRTGRQLSLLLFSLAALYMSALALSNIVHWNAAALFIFAYTLQISVWMLTVRTNDNKRALLQYRSRYRAAYLVAGLSFVALRGWGAALV